jgi:MFS transporter, YNFM family, putative membrane transport protein
MGERTTETFEGVVEGALEGRAGKIERGTAAFLGTNLALFSVGFATVALLYCVQPLMPVFSADFGVTAAQASLALSLSTGLLSVSMLAAGVLSEVWGRKPIMVASLFLSAILTIICEAVPQWPMLLVVRGLTGVALSGLPAIAMAYVAEEMHPRSLGLAMGLYVGGTGLGGMAGRLLTGIVTDLWGWRLAVMVIGVLGLLCAGILWWSLPNSRYFVRREPRLVPLISAFGVHFRDSALQLLFAEGFLLMGSFVTIYNYIGYRLLGPPFLLSQTKIGLVFAVYLCGILGSAWAGGLAGRFGQVTLLPVTLVLMLGGIIMTLFNQVWAIVIGIAVLTFGFFGGHSVASGWIAARARTNRAQASSLYLFAYYLGSSVVGSLGGVFWKLGAWPAVTAMTGILVLLAVAIALRLRFLPTGD